MTHASLFSGIYAAELAARWMGWDNLFHCEVDGFCNRILNYWFPESKAYEDIRETDFTPWRGRVDVLTGGFPCQPFSLAGSRKGAEDDRYLFPEMLRSVSEIRPSWVVGENVAGLITMVQPGSEAQVAAETDIFGKNILYRKKERYVLFDIISSLEGLGYEVQPFVIPACAVEPRTAGKEYGLLPTVQTQGLKENVGGRSLRISPLLLPTPTAIDRGSGMVNRSLGKNAKARPTLARLVRENIPKDGGETFQLSPLYVADMMGFPLMWTVSPFLIPDGEPNP